MLPLHTFVLACGYLLLLGHPEAKAYCQGTHVIKQPLRLLRKVISHLIVQVPISVLQLPEIFAKPILSCFVYTTCSPVPQPIAASASPHCFACSTRGCV